MCKQYFFQTTSTNYSRVILQGKSPLSFISGRISWGGGYSCPVVVVRGGIIQRKVLGGKSPGVSCPEENFIGAIAQGEAVVQRVNVRIS